VIIKKEVEVIGERCFGSDEAYFTIKFEQGSRLRVIESFAFFGTEIEAIIIPSSVEILEEGCFSGC
jgi:hypothetical protein